MYILLECAVIIIFSLSIGTTLFLAAVMTVILKAGWKIAATRSRPLTLRARLQFREQLGVLHPVEIHSDGN